MSTISALPTPPSREDPANFSTRADAFLGALPTFQSEANIVAGEVNTNASNASTAASTATTQAGLAATAKTNAETAAALASDWAVKLVTPVAGGEYSAKYWAQIAQDAVATIPAGTINDSTIALNSVWSSTKVNTGLVLKVNATSGVASALTLNDGYTEEVFVLTGTTPALSASNGSIQTWTLSGNSTPTDSLASGQSLILGITADSNTVTWPSVTWSKVGGSGTAPTLTSTGVNWIVLWKINSTLRGAFLGTA